MAVSLARGKPILMHPALLNGAPRFHTGTPLKADEFAAVLQKGERVLTDRQQAGVIAAASASPGQRQGVNVVVNNNAPNTQASAKQDSGGNTTVTIDDIFDAQEARTANRANKGIGAMAPMTRGTGVRAG